MDYLCKSWYKYFDQALAAAREIPRKDFVNIVPEKSGRFSTKGYAVLFYRDIDEGKDNIEKEEDNEKMDGEAIRAFSNPHYDYYRLTRDLGPLKAGTIFYHDPDDHIYGSVSQGCLKNCWTPDGNCGEICGGTVIFHYIFANSDLFEKVESNLNNIMNALDPGEYSIKVGNNGTWKITKHGIWDGE